MPNWCSNEIEIIADSNEELDEVIQFIKGKISFQDTMSGEHLEEDVQFCFNNIIPQPKDVDDWYTWRVENWGTKWEPRIEFFHRHSSNPYLSILCDTAWNPPYGIYEELSNKFPNVEIIWFYKEPGMCLAGWLNCGD